MTTAFTTDAAGAIPGPDELRSRRRAAAERFAPAELPSTEEEVWRYSRIGDLRLDAYAPVAADHVPDPGDAPSALLDAAEDAVTVWTDRGVVAGVAGTTDGLTIDVDVDPVAGPLGSGLATTDALTDLHDAFCRPVHLSVADGVDAGMVVVVHRAGGDGVASFPRLVVEVGRAATVEVIELFVSDDGARSLSLPVTELTAGRDANLTHSSLQLLGDQSWLIGRLASTVDAGGTLRSATASFGADYSRMRIDTALAGRGAHGEITAAYYGEGTQLHDFRTFQDHVAPDTTSNLLFKGALAEKGASVYTGLIKIRPEARGTQAFQTNRNLKLSEDAWAESVPNLEIENNEVQCSHASTVSPVDPEQRFYLESRGVPTDRADRLIVRGFFDEVLAGLGGPYEALVRDRLDRSLERSMA